MIDYSYYDALLKYCELRCGIYTQKKSPESEAVVDQSYYEKLLRYLELRYNHNHDSKGRFCSGSGEGGSSAKALDKSAESGIIEKEKTMFSEEEVKPMTFSSDYNVPEGLTESASFRSKFCAMDDDPSVIMTIEKLKPVYRFSYKEIL